MAFSLGYSQRPAASSSKPPWPHRPRARRFLYFAEQELSVLRPHCRSKALTSLSWAPSRLALASICSGCSQGHCNTERSLFSLAIFVLHHGKVSMVRLAASKLLVDGIECLQQILVGLVRGLAPAHLRPVAALASANLAMLICFVLVNLGLHLLGISLLLHLEDGVSLLPLQVGQTQRQCWPPPRPWRSLMISVLTLLC